MLRVTKNKSLLVLALAIFFVACSMNGGNRLEQSLSAAEIWAVESLVNKSDNATASDSAEELIETALRQRGVKNIASTPGVVEVVNAASARYVVSGIVHQWGVGNATARGPEVSLSLELFDRHSDNFIWHDTQTVSGRGADSLHKVAQRTIDRLFDQLDISRTAPAAAMPNELVATNDNDVLSPGVITAVRSDALSGTNSLPGSSYAGNQILRGNAVAIYYGANPPVKQLSQFDRLVLEPDNVSAETLAELSDSGAVPYAYLSVGEVGPTRDYAKQLNPGWILTKNADWNSMVMNMNDDGWQSFLLDRVGQLQDAGYRGLFLDTMDSYQIAAKTTADREQQQVALTRFIEKLATQYPAMRLISNRGFEVLDDIAVHLESVAAESLYASWNNAEQRYREVPADDRAWLKGQLDKAKDVHDLDVIVIDYLPPNKRDEAISVASKIATEGFTPWISTPGFDYVGVGSMEVKPREILLLFDSRQNGAIEDSEVHRFIATPLEYFGYVPVYLDVAKEELPTGILTGRYKGVAAWASAPYAQSELQNWIKTQLNNDLPIAFFGAPLVDFDSEIAAKLGVALTPTVDLPSVSVTKRDDMIGFEADLTRRSGGLGISAISKDPDNTSHYSIKDKNGIEADIVVTGSWGGYAMDPGLVDFHPDDTIYWILDPFAFLKQALRLEDLPMPDVTTQAGKRLWLAHIDGDALPSFTEIAGKRRLGAEVIHDQFLTKYPLPHTVSIVEGEMVGLPAYDDRRQLMVDTARKIFALPQVEIASHSYSHPFRWNLIRLTTSSGKYNLPIDNYRFNPEREVSGSVDYIDRELAPANKKTEVFLWTGDAKPGEETLAAVEAAGLLNMNGGLTTISKAYPTITQVSPMARTVGSYTQVYAPIMNENVYTNEWLGPYDGFRRVIETMEMTDKPRRIKPISVYYHFYAGTKQAAIQSLSEIYDWSTKQDINPIKSSDYIAKVADYRRTGVARYLDGSWKLSRLGDIQSLRILREDSWPDLDSSEHIAGAKALHDGIYIHTDGADTVTFKTHTTPPRDTYLAASNGRVLAWEQGLQGLRFRVSATVPVEVEMGGTAIGLCTVKAGSKTIRGKRTRNQTLLFTFTTKDTGDAFLNCQA